MGDTFQPRAANEGSLERTFGQPLRSLGEHIDHLLHFATHGGPVSSPAGSYGPMLPRVDVVENAGEMRISVELPGVREQDIEVKLVDDILSVRAEKRQENSPAERIHLVERSYGTLLRTLRLPYSTVADQVSASFSNGILTIAAPLSKCRESSRTIPIKGAADPE